MRRDGVRNGELRIQAGEYVTVTNGRLPDGRYAIAKHGEGDSGYDNWHVYLMDAQTGKEIGPLEEIKDPLDTASSFCLTAVQSYH
jgi:hypothetical protein